MNSNLVLPKFKAAKHSTMELSESTLNKIKILKSKYASIGQDLDSYLDGLIYANPLTYWDYIEVDALLSLGSLQEPMCTSAKCANLIIQKKS